VSPARRHLRLDDRDNVTTLLDDRRERDRLDGGAPVDPGIAFGHKVALVPIAAGQPVVKYGQPIGHATSDIRVGEHVHVHNCR
jgi:hypothetical protein